jgi:hypothetical protein
MSQFLKLRFLGWSAWPTADRLQKYGATRQRLPGLGPLWRADGRP